MNSIMLIIKWMNWDKTGEKKITRNTIWWIWVLMEYNEFHFDTWTLKLRQNVLLLVIYKGENQNNRGRETTVAINHWTFNIVYEFFTRGICFILRGREFEGLVSGYWRYPIPCWRSEKAATYATYTSTLFFNRNLMRDNFNFR